MSRNTATLLAWLAGTGFNANLEGLRRQYPHPPRCGSVLLQV